MNVGDLSKGENKEKRRTIITKGSLSHDLKEIRGQGAMIKDTSRKAGLGCLSIRSSLPVCSLNFEIRQ